MFHKSILNKLKIFKIRFHKRDKGFTLLELLIVIGILGVLSVALVFVLNPAESLKKARDSQRMSDLTTCLLYTSPSPRDRTRTRMPSSA